MNEFKLFISGETARSEKIIADLDSFLEAKFGREYNLRIIDVIKSPHMALKDGILATPTLVKVNPPMKKVLGNFSDIGIALEKLGIHLLPKTPV